MQVFLSLKFFFIVGWLGYSTGICAFARWAETVVGELDLVGLGRGLYEGLVGIMNVWAAPGILGSTRVLGMHFYALLLFSFVYGIASWVGMRESWRCVDVVNSCLVR